MIPCIFPEDCCAYRLQSERVGIATTGNPPDLDLGLISFAGEKPCLAWIVLITVDFGLVSDAHHCCSLVRPVSLSPITWGLPYPVSDEM
jgi:hypothetical protein